MSRFLLGLDLGQVQDWSALAIVELHQPQQHQPIRRSGEKPEAPSGPEYHVRHLERVKLGTSYPKIVAHVASIMAAPQLRGEHRLVVDATGVGRPVVDLLRNAQLNPTAVTITAGDSETYEGGNYRVPKRDLVSRLQVLLQGGRLKVAERLSEWPICMRELLAFKVKIDPLTAHDSYGYAREGIHDDLVLALALACWGAKPYDHPLGPSIIAAIPWGNSGARWGSSAGRNSRPDRSDDALRFRY